MKKTTKFGLLFLATVLLVGVVWWFFPLTGQEVTKFVTMTYRGHTGSLGYVSNHVDPNTGPAWMMSYLVVVTMWCLSLFPPYQR